MGEVIALVLWVGTSLFFICREIKQKDKRDSHEWWVSEVKAVLRSIEREHRYKCEELTKKYFKQYIDILGSNGYRMASVEALCRVQSEYREEIDALKNEYLEIVNKTPIARIGFPRIDTIPSVLENEYKNRISDTTDTFQNFCYYLSDYTMDIKLAREYGESPQRAREIFEEEEKKRIEDFIKEYERRMPNV